MIAGHLEAAGDLQLAFVWHMRAGAWFNYRDILAARTSWGRARHVADQLAEDDAKYLPTRIMPRTFLCGTQYRVDGGRGAESGFEELR